MGKIPTYQRDRFMSTYVGEPQLDTSGIQAAEGLTNAGTAVVNIEAQKMEERAKVAVDLQANKALNEYSLAYHRNIKELEKTYADDPGKFPEAVASEGAKLQTEYTKNIKDERVAARFGDAANTVIRQNQRAAFNWSVNKQEDNAFVAWRDSIEIAAATSGTHKTVDEFKNDLSAIANTAFSNSLISLDKQIAGFDTGVKAAYSAHLRGRAIEDSVAFTADLNAGAYDKITFTDAKGKSYTETLDAAEKEQYRKLSEDALLTARSRQMQQQLFRSDGESRTLLDGFLAGKSGLGEVVAYQERMNLDPAATKEERDNADELAKLARTITRKEGVPDPAVAWGLSGSYTSLLAKIKKQKNKPEKLLTELLELNTETMKAMNSGEITEAEGRGLLKGLAGYIARGIEKGQSFMGGDPYNGAYRFIDARSKTLADATAKQRNLVQSKAYQGFIDRLMAEEESAPGVKVPKDKYMAMATESWGEAVEMVYPASAASETAVNSTASKSGGVTQVQGAPVDKKAGKTLSNKPVDGQEVMKSGWVYKYNAKENKYDPVRRVSG